MCVSFSHLEEAHDEEEDVELEGIDVVNIAVNILSEIVDTLDDSNGDICKTTNENEEEEEEIDLFAEGNTDSDREKEWKANRQRGIS